jgi:predicted dehydrogenase
MNVLRAGVVGVGHLGRHHARHYASLPGVKLVGVTDTDADQGRKVAQEYGATYYDSLDALLEGGLDLASVAVPTTAHRAVATRLMEGGVDVLVEKPIAASVDEAGQLVETAAKTGRILQVGHIERFNGAVVALFDAVRAPKFIECHRLSPYPMRGQDVSVVLDLMIHDLEIVLSLVKSPVVSIDAVGVPIFSPEEDIANARLQFENGCVANLTSSRVSMERMRKIRIFEPNAYVSTNFSDQEVLIYRKRNVPTGEEASPMDRIEIEQLTVSREEPLKMELEAFVSCVRDRTRPLVSGEDALEALKLAWRALESIRGRR